MASSFDVSSQPFYPGAPQNDQFDYDEEEDFDAIEGGLFDTINKNGGSIVDEIASTHNFNMIKKNSKKVKAEQKENFIAETQVVIPQKTEKAVQKIPTVEKESKKEKDLWNFLYTEKESDYFTKQKEKVQKKPATKIVAPSVDDILAEKQISKKELK